MSPRASTWPPAHMDIVDFLSWTAADPETKYELVDGQPRAMAVAGVAHGTLKANLAAILCSHRRQARPQYRVVIGPAIVPTVNSSSNLRIADLGVNCAIQAATAVALKQPLLLIGILSPGNEQDTRGNVWTYMTIPSVQDILLVSATRVQAELYARGADGAFAGPR